MEMKALPDEFMIQDSPGIVKKENL